VLVAGQTYSISCVYPYALTPTGNHLYSHLWLAEATAVRITSGGTTTLSIYEPNFSATLSPTCGQLSSTVNISAAAISAAIGPEGAFELGLTLMVSGTPSTAAADLVPCKRTTNITSGMQWACVIGDLPPPGGQVWTPYARLKPGGAVYTRSGVGYPTFTLPVALLPTATSLASSMSATLGGANYVPAAGGATLTITGTYFGAAAPGPAIAITIAGTLACRQPAWVSSTTITCVTPAAMFYPLGVNATATVTLAGYTAGTFNARFVAPPGASPSSSPAPSASAPYTQCGPETRFAFMGGVQNYTVPRPQGVNVTGVAVFLVGGGGGGNGRYVGNGNGGGGAALAALLPATGGEQLRVIIGAGGDNTFCTPCAQVGCPACQPNDAFEGGAWARGVEAVALPSRSSWGERGPTL
jgi:hypothetical protein